MHALPLSLARFLALGALAVAASAALAAGQVRSVQAAPSSSPSAAQRAAARPPVGPIIGKTRRHLYLRAPQAR